MNSEREIICNLYESGSFDLKGYHWYVSSASNCTTGYRKYKLSNSSYVVDIQPSDYYDAYDEYRETIEDSEDDSELDNNTTEYYVLRTNPDSSNSIYYYDKDKKHYVWSDVKAGVNFAKSYTDKSKADLAAKRLSKKYPMDKFEVKTK